ncbi:MAG: glycosyltransferase family 2 protein [Solirubrobacterales bacterium]
MTADRQPTAAPPEVSVVIPTHRRETRLAFALEALAAQTLGRQRFEVIVVRSPETPPPHASAPEGLEVRFLPAERTSRPAQRNQGIRAARGPLIAFTDDDCRPAPGWLEALAEAAGRDGGFVCGATSPDPDERHLLHGLARSQTVEELGPWYQTCNVAYPRPLLEQLGGFDERFVASGEDTDLALRALEAGAPAGFASDAVVWHAVLPQPPWEAVGSGWQRWWTTPLLYRRHPAHRRHLWAGLFFARRHAWLVPLAGGLVVARRHRWWATAAAAPYALDFLDPAGRGPRATVRAAIHLPLRAVADASIAAGLIRGSLRYRSPVI